MDSDWAATWGEIWKVITNNLSYSSIWKGEVNLCLNEITSIKAVGDRFSNYACSALGLKAELSRLLFHSVYIKGDQPRSVASEDKLSLVSSSQGTFLWAPPHSISPHFTYLLLPLIPLMVRRSQLASWDTPGVCVCVLLFGADPCWVLSYKLPLDFLCSNTIIGWILASIFKPLVFVFVRDTSDVSACSAPSAAAFLTGLCLVYGLRWECVFVWFVRG